MSLDFGKLAPVASAPEVFEIRRGSEPKVENVFLTKGWLANTYESQEPQMIPDLDGTVSKETVVTKGPKKGQTVKRESYTGDLKTIVKLLREAADELEIGVSVRVTPDLFKSGAKKGEHNGKWSVHFMGQDRRIRRAKTTEEESVTEEELNEAFGDESDD